MGIYDRDYGRYQYDSPSGGTVGFYFPPLSPVVKWLLIINIAVFILEAILFAGKGEHDPFLILFSVYPDSLALTLQVWRVITYQFLHGTFSHLFNNMVGLYFFGPLLERTWGSKKFLKFYLACGAVGGIVYPLLVMMKFLSPGPLIGASGAVLGVITAMAIMYPLMQVYVLGIFPLRIIVLAVILTVWSILGFLAGPNAGGQAAHLGGIGVAVFYVLLVPRMSRSKFFTWQAGKRQKSSEQKNFQAEVDSILEKVHAHGLGSLTRKERKILREATRREQASR